jgi:hypothetical protein
MAVRKPATVKEYLDALPEDRRAVVAAVRKVIRRHLPKGFREALNWGAITYEVPLERFPNTYNGQPLCYVALAAKKNYYTLHLMPVYGNAKRAAWLKEQFDQAGKRLDMGKACVHFKQLDDLPLDAIGQLVAGTSPAEWIACYEASRRK